MAKIGSYLLMFSLLTSCFLKENTVNIGNEFQRKEFRAPPYSKITSVSIHQNKLKIKGVDFSTVKTIQIKNNSGFNEVFKIDSLSNSSIIANSTKNLSFLIGATFDLILSNAYGAVTFPIIVDITNLTPSIGQFLMYDGTNWVPNNLTIQTYKGIWKSDGTGLDISTGGLVGDYYIIDNPIGDFDPNTHLSTTGALNWNLGDWVLWNDVNASWDRIPNSNSAPATGDILGTYPNLTIGTGKVTDSKIVNISVSKIISGNTKYFDYKPNGIACTDNQILEYDSAIPGWTCVSPSSNTSVGSVNSTNLSLASGTGDVQIKTGTSNTRMTIKNAGNIEVGTTLGTTSNFSIANSGNSVLEIGTDTSNKSMVTWDNTNKSLNFGTTNATTAFPDALVLKDGNVGIGTTAPSAKLEVNGDIVANSITSTTTSYNKPNFFNPVRGDQNWALGISSNSPTNFWMQAKYHDIGNNMRGFRLYDTNSNSVVFATNKQTSYFASGNVGIGTAAPTANLEIVTSALGVNLNDTLNMLNIRSTTNVNTNHLEFKHIRTSAGTTWQSSSTRIQEKIDGTWMSYMQFNGTGNESGISFGTGLTTVAPGNVSEAMRITNTGNVGIGTTAPVANLDVNGAIAYHQEFGRAGTAVPADGLWHSISDQWHGAGTGAAPLTGINALNAHNAFRLVADYAISSCHALVSGPVVNVYMGQQISNVQTAGINLASAGFGGCTIETRWYGSTYNYRLEIRSNGNKISQPPAGIVKYINYKLIKTW